MSALASECATILIDGVVAAVPDGLCRLISQLITETTFPVNLAALQILLTKINEDFEITDSRLAILVSCLLKVFILFNKSDKGQCH